MAGRRSSALGPTEIYLLNQWGRALREGWGHTAYLVGSVVRDEPWRDVDVRLMLPDDRFDAVFGGVHAAGLKPTNVAYTVWGQRITGLPIDFQFQSFTEGNADPNGLAHLRRPLRVHAEPAPTGGA